MPSSDLSPKEVSPQTGVLKRVYIAGRVVRVREREFDADTATQEPKGGGKEKKGKGKEGSKAKGKGKGPKKVFEIHLSGGKTPADVIVFEAWDVKVQERLRPLAQLGKSLRVKNVLVKHHTDKTRPYSTSRSAVFLRAVEETTVEACSGLDDTVPSYHPVTPVADLHYLPEKTLVCVGARVVPPAPVCKDVDVRGRKTRVCNAALRMGEDQVRLSGWEGEADQVFGLEVGKIYYFDAVSMRKASNDEGQASYELRVMKNMTKIEKCPEPLSTEIDTATATDGPAHSWTLRGGGRRQYESEEAKWYTLSVCEAISTPQIRRQIDLLCQIPSVFIQNFAGRITYFGCSQCKRSWQEEDVQPCGCAAAQRCSLWKATASMVDSTAQVSATMFESLGTLTSMYAEHETERRGESCAHLALPATYESDEEITGLCRFLNPIPFTMRISFMDSEYTNHPELCVQLVAPTFSNRDGVKHPLSKMVEFATPSYGCPPCPVAETKFSPGIGLAHVPGGVTTSFRVLLEIMDNASGATRDESSNTLKVTRRCACALRDTESAETYLLTQNGPLDVTTLLLQVRKNEYVHAIVSWRSSDAISLNAFWALPAVEVTKFRQFFQKECEIFAAMARG